MSTEYQRVLEKMVLVLIILEYEYEYHMPVTDLYIVPRHVEKKHYRIYFKHYSNTPNIPQHQHFETLRILCTGSRPFDTARH